VNDSEYMHLAIELAKKTTGQTTPNPVVGSVVVKDGKILGIGVHIEAGGPHAEVHALNMAGEAAVGATIYVTLEPCSHFGKTPPCADLIIERGIKRVVIASTDPNPQVAGQGIKRLQHAGIEVEVGLLKSEAVEINKVFFHFIQRKRPFVTLKTATSLDGKIATANGESKWITSEQAREDVHYYRHRHDAILVGVNTVMKDNPSLTTRLQFGGKNPIRIIMDTHLRTPPDAMLVNDGLAQTWIITGKGIDESKKQQFKSNHVSIFSIDAEKIEIERLLELLGEHGITSLFVEGGAEINGSFLKSRQINEIITYIAPKLIGGRLSPTAFAGDGIQRMDDAQNFKIKSVERIGPDIKIISIPEEDFDCLQG
jgi:diaminohydroxyphosphoribosylaminopyrimidine deaminase/5-amino-6-(5-phosphoribosylamino)uracil reductase